MHPLCTSRRHFISLAAHSLLVSACLDLRADSLGDSSEVFNKLQASERYAAEQIALTINHLYKDQFEQLKSGNGYATISDVNRKLRQFLGEIKPHLEALGATESELQKIEIKDYTMRVNAILAKKHLVLMPAAIKTPQSNYAISILFASTSVIELPDDQQVRKLLAISNPPPFYDVNNIVCPDLRTSTYWPYASDRMVYGQTFTSSITQKPDMVLIYSSNIKKRAEFEKLPFNELRDLTIANELANVAFRTHLSIDQGDRKISDKITIKHLAEAFSDYITFQVASGALLINEIKRILQSKNPNYLLSKALTANALIELMEVAGEKKVEDYIALLERSPEMHANLKIKLCTSYESFPQISLIKSGNWDKVIDQ